MSCLIFSFDGFFNQNHSVFLLALSYHVQWLSQNVKEILGFFICKFIQYPVNHNNVIVIFWPNILKWTFVNNLQFLKCLFKSLSNFFVKVFTSIDQQTLSWVVSNHDSFAHSQLLSPPVFAWLKLLENGLKIFIIVNTYEVELWLVRSLFHDWLEIFIYVLWRFSFYLSQIFLQNIKRWYFH